MEQKYIYLVRYKINLTCDEKFKSFDTIEGAHEFHAKYKENTAKAGYPGREIEHYDILCVPHNVRSKDEPEFYAAADTTSDGQSPPDVVGVPTASIELGFRLNNDFSVGVGMEGEE